MVKSNKRISRNRVSKKRISKRVSCKRKTKLQRAGSKSKYNVSRKNRRSLTNLKLMAKRTQKSLDKHINRLLRKFN